MFSYSHFSSFVFFFFFFNDTATTEIYTLSLHDALPIFRVADQREEVRDQDRVHTKLSPHAVSIAHLVAAAINLHHALAANALGQILVRCPDADLLHALIGRGDARGGGERVVGLELDHGPHHDAHG